jgi:peptidoglycan/LPS O-acetylase OafA/YrhL
VPAWGIPAALVVYGARSLDDRFAGRAFDLPVLLGDASFSIYLFHKLFTGLGLNWLVDACVAMMLCVASM